MQANRHDVLAFSTKGWSMKSGPPMDRLMTCTWGAGVGCRQVGQGAVDSSAIAGLASVSSGVSKQVCKQAAGWNRDRDRAVVAASFAVPYRQGPGSEVYMDIAWTFHPGPPVTPASFPGPSTRVHTGASTLMVMA